MIRIITLVTNQLKHLQPETSKTFYYFLKNPYGIDLLTTGVI